MEHRCGNRTSVDVPVQIRYRAGGWTEARIANISRTGALVRTKLPMSRLASFDILIDGQTISAFVTRVESGGVGAEWCGSSPEIFALVSRLQLAAAPEHHVA